jgi:hypothetical protein
MDRYKLTPVIIGEILEPTMDGELPTPTPEPPIPTDEQLEIMEQIRQEMIASEG